MRKLHDAMNRGAAVDAQIEHATHIVLCQDAKSLPPETALLLQKGAMQPGVMHPAVVWPSWLLACCDKQAQVCLTSLLSVSPTLLRWSHHW